MRYFPEWIGRPPAVRPGAGKDEDKDEEKECKSYFGGGYAEEVGYSDASKEGASNEASKEGAEGTPTHPGYPEQGKRFSRGGMHEHSIHDPDPGDERLHELICESLLDDPRIDPDDVAVSVHDHEVTLEGSVPEPRMKEAIEDLIERTGEVRDIHDHLRVRAEQR